MIWSVGGGFAEGSRPTAAAAGGDARRDDGGLAGWEYTQPAEYRVVDTHVHVWEEDGVMGAMTASSQHLGVHQHPELRPVPPRWSSEPKDSGRVELLLNDMHQNGVDGAVVVQTSFSTW
jgi:hypothetical protein